VSPSAFALRRVGSNNKFEAAHMQVQQTAGLLGTPPLPRSSTRDSLCFISPRASLSQYAAAKFYWASFGQERVAFNQSLTEGPYPVCPCQACSTDAGHAFPFVSYEEAVIYRLEIGNLPTIHLA
jgi:hypothetical protein